MNVIVRQEFELTFFKDAVQHFNHYTTGTYPLQAFIPKLMFFYACKKYLLLLYI